MDSRPTVVRSIRAVASCVAITSAISPFDRLARYDGNNHE